MVSSLGLASGSFKKAELRVLYSLYSQDNQVSDVALDFIIANKVRYRDPILHMLDTSEYGSFDLAFSQNVAKYLLNDAVVKSKLEYLANNHPEKDIRCYWHDVVHERFEEAPINLGNGDLVYYTKDNGSSCI